MTQISCGIAVLKYDCRALEAHEGPIDVIEV
jgi:hypothetical protein